MSRSWHQKPPPDVRSLKDAIAAAERLRSDLRLVVQVHASDWDKVILVDELYRLRRTAGSRGCPEALTLLHEAHHFNNAQAYTREEMDDFCERLAKFLGEPI
jgi:hypothetical protein